MQGDGSRLVIVTLSLLTAGAYTLALGWAILKRKPVVLPSRISRGAVVFLVLPAFVYAVFDLVAHAFSSRDFQSLWRVVPLLGVEGALLGMLVLLIPQGVHLFNVTEVMVFEALNAVLREQGLNPHIDTQTGCLARLFGQQRRVVQLDGVPWSIVVGVWSTGHGLLRVRHKRDIADYEGLLARLTRLLASYTCGRNAIVTGVPIILIGLGALVFVVYIWTDRLFGWGR